MNEKTDLMTPMVVVTADSHVGPLMRQIREYCPKDRLEQFDEFVTAAAANRIPFREYPEGDPRKDHPASAAGVDLAMRNGRTEGHFDMHARLRDMDRDGVAAEIIFHGSQNGEPFPFIDSITGAAFFNPTGDNLALVRTGMRMYNQWLADAVSIEPERHAGLAQLPMWDIDEATKELTWAREAGLRGVNLPAPRPGILDYDHLEWEPFWTACEDLEMTLTTHAGAGDPSSLHGRQRILMMVMEAGGYLTRRALQRLIFGGVFTRHPRLKLVFTELTEYTDDWWLPTLREFDRYYEKAGWMLGDQLPKPPSEYVREQVFVGDSLMHRTGAGVAAAAAVRDGYDDNLLWGSDYPHIEGTWELPDDERDEPTTRLALRHSFTGVPASAARKMAGENAARVYGLDLSALAAVATRIGALAPADLAVAPDVVPAHWSAPSVTAL